MQNEKVADGDVFQSRWDEITQTEGYDWRDRRGFTEAITQSTIFSLLVWLLFVIKNRQNEKVVFVNNTTIPTT